MRTPATRHFLSIAAKVMQQILIDHARGRKAPLTTDSNGIAVFIYTGANDVNDTVIFPSA